MRATVERFHLEPEDMSPVQLVAEVRRLRAEVRRLRAEVGALADEKPGATGRALRAILDPGTHEAPPPTS